MFVRVFFGDCFQDIKLDGSLDRVVIGNDAKCTLNIPSSELRRDHISILSSGDNWQIHCKGNVYLNGEVIKDTYLEHGQVFILSPNERISMLVIDEYSLNRTRANLSVDEIKIGRGDDCNIVVNSPLASSNHALLKKMGGVVYIYDLNSKNGTYLNGQKITKAVLKETDEIVVANSKIVFLGNKIEVEGADLQATQSQTAPIRTDLRPMYKQSPRLKAEVPSKTVEIETPPTISDKPEINWLSVFLMPAIMLVAFGVMGAATGGIMCIFMLASPILAVVNYNSQKKKHKIEVGLRLQKYKDYLKTTQNDINEFQAKCLSVLTTINVAPKDCYNIILNGSDRLWERTIFDNDFLSLNIGYGTIPSNVEIKLPRQTLTIYEDELLNTGLKIKEDNEYIYKAPVQCDCRNNNIIGVIGYPNESKIVVKNMILEAATLHSYKDLTIVTIFNAKEYNEWAWVRWLPHSFDEDRVNRYMASNPFEVSELENMLSPIIKNRFGVAASENNKARIGDFNQILFVIADMSLIEGTSIENAIHAATPSLGISAIIMTQQKHSLYMECNQIIDMKSNSGIIYNPETASDYQEFTLHNLDPQIYEMLARKLAPITLYDNEKATSLPSCVTFLDGYNVKKPSEVDIVGNWKNAMPYKTLSVPIAVRANGEPFMFDIHEKKYGPHGLVAGMTGSGKSEMVQSWILSMALHFSPKDVSFVLVDFKGTGLIKPFEDLPHLAGTISNIDHKITRNLIALECELTRRQVLFNQYGVQNISDYQKLYHKGETSEALSSLVIIIDEFAEFKSQFPEFIPIIDRIFAIGRTLGVFIMLLTQKPTGVVSDKMNANTRFRWCLKVATSADSKEMLHHPDAAKITVPGRAYVQVGEDELYEQVQSYWSGAPYMPNKRDKTTVVPKICTVSLTGKRVEQKDNSATMSISTRSTKSDSDIKEINAIVSYLDEFVAENGYEKARRVWSDKLPDVMYLEDIVKSNFDGESWLETEDDLVATVGMIDDPRKQTQYPATVNLSEDGHVGIFGAPSTGKTIFLQTLITSLVTRYNPDDVNLYIIDCNTWGLNMFSKYPHVGGVANDSEDEKINKLIIMLTMELKHRRDIFAEQSVSSVKTYREATGERLPYIVIVIDNFAPLVQTYENADSFFLEISRQGGGYGIYMVATGNNTNALTYKIYQNVKTGIALQMTDKTDYSAIVGKTGGLEPDSNDGRGLMKVEGSPLEFQTALPIHGNIDTQRVVNIKELGSKMVGAWHGKKASPIPIMPDTIPLNSAADDGITIGLSTKTVNPVTVDFNKYFYMTITGAKRMGKSNLLKALAKQFKKCGSNVTFIDIESTSEDISSIVDAYYNDATVIDAYFEKLSKELQVRKESGVCEEQIVILLDDFKKCFEAIDDATVKRMEAIINLGANLNIIFIVADDSQAITSMASIGCKLASMLIGGPIHILLGNNFKAHPMFEADMTYSEMEAKLGEYEGYLLIDRSTEQFKAIYCE